MDGSHIPYQKIEGASDQDPGRRGDQVINQEEEEEEENSRQVRLTLGGCCQAFCKDIMLKPNSTKKASVRGFIVGLPGAVLFTIACAATIDPIDASVGNTSQGKTIAELIFIYIGIMMISPAFIVLLCISASVFIFKIRERAAFRNRMSMIRVLLIENQEEPYDRSSPGPIPSESLTVCTDTGRIDQYCAIPGSSSVTVNNLNQGIITEPMVSAHEDSKSGSDKRASTSSSPVTPKSGLPVDVEGDQESDSQPEVVVHGSEEPTPPVPVRADMSRTDQKSTPEDQEMPGSRECAQVPGCSIKLRDLEPTSPSVPVEVHAECEESFTFGQSI